MVIAIDITDSNGPYHAVLTQLAAAHPQHSFIVFTKQLKSTGWPSNTQVIAAGPASIKPISLRWWYQYRLPALLKKHNASILLAAGAGFCLRTAIPQIILATGSTTPFIQKWLTIKDASVHQIFTITDSYRLQWAPVQPNIPATVLPPVVSELWQPSTPSEQQTIQEKYTCDRAFFFCTAHLLPDATIISLLKAFSLFKKRQLSNRVLVLSGPVSNAVQKSLETYKYRNDVVILPVIPETELAKIVAAAYTLLHGAMDVMPLLQALCCCIPAITLPADPLQQLSNGAALYVSFSNTEELAAQLMELYKNEALHRQLSNGASLLAVEYSSHKQLSLLQQTLLKLANP